MNKGKQEKEAKEEYKIKDIFTKESVININEILKKYFLLNLKTIELD